MWPNIGPIKTYGVLYLIGIILHFVIGWRIARCYGLPHRVWIAAGICYLLGMLFFAKVLFDWRHGILSLSTLLQADHWVRGGLWGGLLAYFPLAIAAVLLLSRQRLAALDLIAVTIPIPWIAAKLGCFFNGCCHGRPCSLPWAVTFPQGARGAPAGIPLHPTQLYEIGIMLVVLLIYSQLKSDRSRGTRLLWFFVIYGFGRAATDFLRGDTEGRLYLGVLSLTQLLSGASAVVALLLLGLRLHARNCRARLAQDDCV
ncbi:MAG: prolipoprotein diacylglyceryl transferase family protein [Phycisphaerales bacterium]